MAAIRSMKLKVAEDAEDPDSSAGEGESDTAEDVIHQEYEPLEESIYGWAASMVVRDVVWINDGTAMPLARLARILNSIFLIVCTNSLQIFLLIAISRLLSAPAVAIIRETYGAYEALMYPNHTELTVNGFPRGIPGYLVEENFLKMATDDAKNVCQVPLSHPFYLISILFIWTLTCHVELRQIVEKSTQLLWNTPMVKTIAQVVEPAGDEEHSVNVVGLTFIMKFVIGVFVMLPRMLTLLALLYLGCRWLTATLGLGQLLLNCVALEFMVLLKELLYNVCVSHRIHFHTQRLLIRPLRDVNKAMLCTFFDSQVWGILSVAWAWLYVYHFQMVLPEYRWDLRAICTKYIKAGPVF